MLCQVDYCAYCTAPNMCAECLPSFTQGSGAEGELTCACAEGEKVWNNTCVACDVQYCSYCVEPNVCNMCLDTFVYIEDNVCRCPDSFTLSMEDMMCYECDIDFCELCTETAVCNTCMGDLIPATV